MSTVCVCSKEDKDPKSFQLLTFPSILIFNPLSALQIICIYKYFSFFFAVALMVMNDICRPSMHDEWESSSTNLFTLHWKHSHGTHFWSDFVNRIIITPPLTAFLSLPSLVYVHMHMPDDSVSRLYNWKMNVDVGRKKYTKTNFVPICLLFLLIAYCWRSQMSDIWNLFFFLLHALQFMQIKLLNFYVHEYCNIGTKIYIQDKDSIMFFRSDRLIATNGHFESSGK